MKPTPTRFESRGTIGEWGVNKKKQKKVGVRTHPTPAQCRKTNNVIGGAVPKPKKKLKK